MARRRPASRTINLALQGGGAHGAFTWGVLDRLLEDPRIEFDGVCGTSAGAMNAVVFAHGLMHGGRDGARAALEDFWRRVSRLGAILSPVRPVPGMQRIPGFDPQAGVALSHWFFESFTRAFSPYQFNPLNINPLRELLDAVVDFEALHRCTQVKLFLCATNVRSGKVKIFDNSQMSLDAVMASACLPFLFQAVEIDGEHYWDGGYTGNPALWPLFYRSAVRDLVIVLVNAIRRESVPQTPVDIADRVNEISFNSSLLRELRAVEFVTRMVTGGWLKDEHAPKLRHVLMHTIRADTVMAELGVSSKLNPDWNFLSQLRDRGRAVADDWLAQHYADLGKRSTVDLRREFVDG